MFQTQAKIGRRAVLMGMFGAAAGMTLVACGGKGIDVAPATAPATVHVPPASANTTVTAVTSDTPATTAPTHAAPTQVANAGKSSGTAPRAKSLLSKEEIEAVLGMPVKDAKELETYDGNFVSFYPIGVTAERGGNMAYDLKGFTDTFHMTEPLPEFGNQAFASASQSDIVVLKDGTLVCIGTAGVQQDGVTLDMLKTLMRKALSRI
jgi:hypothetical protein